MLAFIAYLSARAGRSVVLAGPMAALLGCTGVTPPLLQRPDAEATTETDDTCANLQSDARNCGACGHDCLPGGVCQGGRCLPAVVLETSLQPTVFAMDQSHVYFFQDAPDNTTTDVYRVEKHGVGGPAEVIATGLPGAALIGVAGPLLLWNASAAAGGPGRGVTCEIASCAATIANPFGSDGEIVPFNTSVPASILLRSLDTATATLRLTWYAVAGVTPTRLASDPVSLEPGATVYGFFASGDSVYWGSWPPKGADGPWGSLYGKTTSLDTQRPARLAGSLSFHTFIIDVNRQSVLLIDIQDYQLYRVPLPLGLGAGAPQIVTAAGMPVVAATEDADAVYWFDAQGTLYGCTPASCAATQTVLANGQDLGTNRLYQDSEALYWGTENPHRIVRLAK